MTNQAITREQWLETAVRAIAIDAAILGVELPPVKVSCSWPGGGSARKRIGECWSRSASKAKINEIFVSPKLEDPVEVVGVLAHELAHAVDDCKSGHGKDFTAIARKLKLEGKPTQMKPTPEMAKFWADAAIREHGPYPHRVLDKSKSPIKKQATRMLKCECMACGAIWRLTQSVIDRVDGSMSCPVCHEHDDNVAVGG